MLEFATYSVISPEGCASILWKSAERARDAAEADGHSRTALPHADERPADGLLRLLSPASPWTRTASCSPASPCGARLCRSPSGSPGSSSLR